MDCAVNKRNTIQRILSQSIEIPGNFTIQQISEMRAWCRDNVGEERPGDMFDDITPDGYIHHSNGYNWQELYHIVEDLHRSKFIFWFAKQSDRVRFSLTWT